MSGENEDLCERVRVLEADVAELRAIVESLLAPEQPSLEEQHQAFADRFRKDRR
jgi:hypothetical protein